MTQGNYGPGTIEPSTSIRALGALADIGCRRERDYLSAEQAALNR
jgi:hypothetical protein